MKTHPKDGSVLGLFLELPRIGAVGDVHTLADFPVYHPFGFVHALHSLAVM